MPSKCTNGSTVSALRWIAPRFAVNFPTLLSRTSNHGRRSRIGVRFMSKAVQFDSYGGIDVLEVRDVPRPVPGHGEALVQVRAAGINPSEAVIRSGALHHLFPATFPPVRAVTWRERWPNSVPAPAVSLAAARGSGLPLVAPH